MKKVAISLFILPVILFSQSTQIDSTFGSQGSVEIANFDPKAIEIQSDGKILVGGGSNTDNHFIISRFNSNGSLDNDFGTNGVVKIDFSAKVNNPNSETFQSSCTDIKLQSNGKIIAIGYHAYKGQNKYARPIVVRFNADGTLDTSFNSDGIFTEEVDGSILQEPNSIAIGSDGSIYLSGVLNTATRVKDIYIIKLTSSGAQDLSFAPTAKSFYNNDIGGGQIAFNFSTEFDNAGYLALDSDDNIYLATYSLGQNSYDIVLSKYSADGTSSTSFGNTYSKDYYGNNMNLALPINLFTLEDSGNTYYSNDQVIGIHVDDNGRLIIGANTVVYYDFSMGGWISKERPYHAAVRINNGQIDSTYGTNGITLIDSSPNNPKNDYRSSATNSMSIDYKGRLIEAGYVYNVNTDTSSIVIARYRTDGKADSTLGKSGFLVTKLGKNDALYDLTSQSDGKILAIGKKKISDSNIYFIIRFLEEYPNSAPAISIVNNITINEDESSTVTLTATDADGDAITYSAVSDTNAVTVSVSSTTLTLTPNANWHGVANIKAYASDGISKGSTTFTLSVTPVNDAPLITTVADDSTNEETEKVIVLDASDVDGDALTYTATSDTSGVAVTISSDTLKLTPALNYSGTSVITVIVSDNALTDTTKFDFKVINVNDAPVIAAVSDVTFAEDTTGSLVLSATDIDGDAVTYSAKSSRPDVVTTVSKDTLTLTPAANWNGTSVITAIALDGKATDSTSFTLTVSPVQDLPSSFSWVSVGADSINISQSNLADTYSLQWGASTDVDGDSIDYLVSAKVGVYPSELIYDTTVTTLPLSYQEIVENVFEGMPNERATVRFSVSATDGIDTVKVTGDDRVLFVNRYDYLSTEGEGIPTEFALHENYPNPFNPTTTLRFDLPEVSDVTITIYNMLGQKVRTFNMNDTPAGYHSIKWDATNDYGDPVGAGIYFYQLQANQFLKTKKMVLLK